MILTGIVRTQRSPTLILGSTSSTPLISPPLPTRVKYGSGVAKISSIFISPLYAAKRMDASSPIVGFGPFPDLTTLIATPDAVVSSANAY